MLDEPLSAPELVDRIVETISPLLPQAESTADFGVALLAAYLAYAQATLGKSQNEAIDFTIEYLRDFQKAGLEVGDVQGNA